MFTPKSRPDKLLRLLNAWEEPVYLLSGRCQPGWLSETLDAEGLSDPRRAILVKKANLNIRALLYRSPCGLWQLTGEGVTLQRAHGVLETMIPLPETLTRGCAAAPALLTAGTQVLSTATGELIFEVLRYGEIEIGLLPLRLVHQGPTRRAGQSPSTGPLTPPPAPPSPSSDPPRRIQVVSVLKKDS